MEARRPGPGSEITSKPHSVALALEATAMTDLNPQARQMADESMVRSLDTRARAISLNLALLDGNRW